jgi:hypothetical protein
MGDAAVVNSVRRCAWCDRVWTGDGWRGTPGEPDHEHETATICPDCADDLTKLLGQSGS